MSVRTTVEPLEKHKVKLHVEVDKADFDKAVDDAFRKLASEVRIPGFRKGKVPRRLLEARIGMDALREEALKDALPTYYAEALTTESIDAVSAPEIDNVSADEGEDVSFDAVVEVRPKIDLGDWRSMEVTVPASSATDEEIDNQLERQRVQFSELEPVGRPAADGDFVSIDIRGSIHNEEVPGTVANDLLYQIGSKNIVDKLDEELTGKRSGDILKFNDTLPEGFAERAGEEVTFSVLVKEVSARRLPDVNDAWVQDVSEFTTVDELRADVGNRVSTVKAVEAAVNARNAVMEALVERVDEEPPGSMVGHEMEHQLETFLSRLHRQGIELNEYLEAIGQDQERFIEELKGRAVSSVKADLALRAIADAEDLAASEEEIEAEVVRMAERTNRSATDVRKSLQRSGAWEMLRSDIVRRAALEFAVRSVEIKTEDGTVVDVDQLLSPLGSSDSEAEPDASEEDHSDDE